MSTSVNAPLELYPLHLGRYDESRDVTGRMRAGWRDLLTRLQNMAPKALNQRLAWIDHSLQENGVIFRPHGETESHPWLLDPLPLILSSKEWGVLAQAVAQRARLFDAILADLYGPQRLLTQGLLPPALIFGQHGFLWPCFGLRPVAGVFLHRYAVRPRTLPRRTVVGDRRSHPEPGRSGLCSGKSSPRLAGILRGVSRITGPTAGWLLSGDAAVDGNLGTR